MNQKKKKDTGTTVTGKRKKSQMEDIDSDSEEEEEKKTEEEAPPEDRDLYVLSWGKVSAYKDITSNISDYVVICDEAHSLQSMASKRTEDTLKLVLARK